MTNVKSGILARFHAPITKLALSLCAIGIASAAQADDMLYWWEGETIFDEMVSTNGSVWVGSSEAGVFAENWHVWKSDDGTLNKGITQTEWKNIRVADLENNKGRLKIESGLYHAMNDIIVGGGANCDAHLWVAGGRFESLYWMKVGEDQSSNATVAVTGGELYVGTADNGSTVVLGSGDSASASLSVSGTGSFTCNTITMAGGDDSQATFTVDGGTATVAAINRAGTDEVHGTATVQLKNGTLVSTTAAGGDFIPAANGLSVEVTGGTINNEYNISISAAITGAGWLTKTGVGTLSLTNSNVAGFTGRITVAENAGSVTIPATATHVKVGSYTAKEATEDGIVFTHSATDLSWDNHWTGNDASNEWSAPGNWDTGLEGANNYVIRSNEMNGEPVTVEFAAANSISTGLWIENLLSGVVTFSSDAGGLETAGLTVGTGTSGALAIASGAYSSSWVNIGTGGGSASFTMESGTLASAGDFNVAITGATSEFTQNGGTITSGANGWWGADNSKAVADINDGSISFTGNLNLLNQNGTGDAASYITNNIAGGALSANEIWFLGKAGHATVNLSSGTIETGKFGVNGSGIYAINISGGTLKAAADNATFIPASEKLTVTVSGNATLNTNGKTITIDAAMLGDGTLTCVGGGIVTFTSLDSTCNIVANGATVNQPQAYYWIGGAAGEWNDGSNWSLSADGDAANEYPNTVSDTVVIGTPATITLTDNVVVREVVVTADVVFSGEKSLGFATMRGEGLVTMSNVTFTNTSEDLTPFVIFNNICLAKGSDNTLDGADLANYVYGDISGSGNITVKYKHSGDNDKGGTHFCGDNSGFAGTLTFSRDSGSYSRLWLDGGAASSENAIWQNLYCYAPSGNAYIGSTYLMTPNESYKFGGIQGGVFYGSSDVTIEIGAREDFNSAFELKTHGSRPRGYITKVGSGALTLNGFPYVLTLKGGTTYLGEGFGFADYSGRSSSVTFAGEGATLAFSGYTGDPSGRIKNSTSAIIFDDGGADYIWATALAASNVGGLTKNGSGTLTLATLPAYKGPTKVLAGKLVVPFGTKFESLALEGDASVEVDMTEAVPNAVAFSSGRFTGDATKVTFVNIPDGYTVQNIGSAENIIYGNGSTTYTWVGPTSTFVNEVETSDYAWETETNWTPNGVPAALDVVVFGTAAPKFTLASDVSVMSVIVNGDGGFSYSADHALTVIGNLNVATAGTLQISGAGSLEVNGVVSGVTDVTMTPQAATSAIIAAHPYYTEKFRSGYDLNLTALTGGGTIQSSADQSVTVAQNTTSTFYGTLTGTMGLTKSGEGTLELQGPNSFTGDIAIEAGTLAVSRYNFDSLVSYNFDASNVDKWTFADSDAGTISKMTTSTGAKWTFRSAGSTYACLTNGFFGGKTSIFFPAYSQYVPDYTSQKNYRAYSVFTVAQTEDVASTHYLHCYSTSQDYIGLSGGYWQAHSYNSYINNLLYVDGLHDRAATASKKSVVSLLSEYACSNNRWDALGIANSDNGYVGAVGEIIGLNVRASIEQRAAIESYLMQKWGCDDAEDHQILPKTADVTMNAGATLDMGGLTQTVKSFTGAGTVANGYLKTTGDLTVDGGTLTIQATTDQTYVLSDVETERLVLTGNAKGYTIKVPENAKIVGRFVVPEGIKVGLEGEDGLDVTVHLGEGQKGWEITGKPVAGGILYRVGSFPFVLKLR